MMFLKKLWNADLLYAVRKDAVRKAKDYKDISLLVCILDFAETVSRKRVEGLLQEIADYPRDIPLFDITIKGMEYILAGLGTDELVEVLTQNYWESPVKESFAQEFSTMCRLEESEEIIKDTKFRYRALLDTSLDVFTGDRMENKSYQLPFAMYFVAKTMFKEPVAAIASEALMTVGNWDYRVRSNLLKFILFDDDPTEMFLEKMTIFFMSLEECRSLEDVYMSDCKDIPFAEYYPELLREMADVDYGQVLRILKRIRKAPKQYYHIYDNVLWRACEIRVPEEMRQMYRRQGKIKWKYSTIGMENNLEDFVKKDMYDYINKGYVASYNPFWLFGSSGYKDNIDFIFQRKHVVEFDVVWIQYLFLKAKNEEKEVEYINLLPDKSVQRSEACE